MLVEMQSRRVHDPWYFFLFSFIKKNAAQITLRLGHYNQKYTKNISNETRVSLAHLFNDSSRACPSLQRQRQESWYPRPSCIPRFQLNANSIPITICTHPPSENVDWFRCAWHQPSTTTATAAIHSQLVCSLIKLMKFCRCCRLTANVQLAVLTCYLPSSLKARSLACSPGFVAFLQKIHENGGQSQCGISITFHLYTAHEHKIQRTVEHNLCHSTQAHEQEVCMSRLQSYRELRRGPRDKDAGRIAGQRCCMPLSAEQARSCQLFLGKNRFCQP